jgi:hypothetical protein
MIESEKTIPLHEAWSKLRLNTDMSYWYRVVTPRGNLLNLGGNRAEITGSVLNDNEEQIYSISFEDYNGHSGCRVDMGSRYGAYDKIKSYEELFEFLDKPNLVNMRPYYVGNKCMNIGLLVTSLESETKHGMQVENFTYDGMFVYSAPGLAPYTAAFEEWSVDPGMARCKCSDGIYRLIPSCKLVGFNKEDYPIQKKPENINGFIFGVPCKS